MTTTNARLPYASAIDASVAFRSLIPRFRDELEQRYSTDTAGDRLDHFIVSCAMSTLFFIPCLVADHYLLSDVFSLALRLSIGACLLTSALLWAMARHRQWWLSKPYVWTETAVAAQCILFAAVVATLLARTHAPLGYLYHAVYVVVILMYTVMYRLRFISALALSVLVMFVHMVGVALTPEMPLPLRASLILLNLAVAGYALAASRYVEIQERRRYVLSVRERQLLLELAETQARLQTLFLSDALTELPNRRRLERYLGEQWHITDRDLSILLIDVDHFKAYNDRYGHPSGDECLRHLAQAFARAVESKCGLVARWGGEEFIAVLPGCSNRDALNLAQHLLTTVQALSIRHESSTVGPSVTVSIGVATRSAHTAMAAADALIEQADQALYMAKEEGRNRVKSYSQKINAA